MVFVYILNKKKGHTGFCAVCNGELDMKIMEKSKELEKSPQSDTDNDMPGEVSYQLLYDCISNNIPIPSGTVFKKCQFIDVVFGRDIIDCTFKDCIFERCSFANGIVMNSCCFSQCSFLDIKRITLSDCDFLNCSIAGILKKTILFNCRFSHLTTCNLQITKSMFDSCHTREGIADLF